MRKFLRRFFILLRVAIVVMMLTNGAAAYYVHTCESLAILSFRDLTQTEITDEFDWQRWIREHYGYWAWDIYVFPGRDITYVSWTTPLYSYSYYHFIESGDTYVAQYARYFSPTLGDVLRCFGEPSHYAAFTIDNGIGTDYIFGLWYPKQGVFYGSRFEFIHNQNYGFTPDGQYAFKLSKSALLFHASPTPPQTFDDGTPLLRPWTGIDAITFDHF